MSYPFIKQQEGKRNKPYKDIGGVWTVGYGSTANVDPNKVYSDKEVDDLFNKDIETHLAPIKGLGLSPNQEEAIGSYIFNVGPNHKSVNAIVDKIKQNIPLTREDFKINTVNGKFNQALNDRRDREYALYSGSANIPKLTGSTIQEPESIDTRELLASGLDDPRMNQKNIEIDNRIPTISVKWEGGWG